MMITQTHDGHISGKRVCLSFCYTLCSCTGNAIGCRKQASLGLKAVMSCPGPLFDSNSDTCWGPICRHVSRLSVCATNSRGIPKRQQHLLSSRSWLPTSSFWQQQQSQSLTSVSHNSSRCCRLQQQQLQLSNAKHTPREPRGRVPWPGPQEPTT